MPAPTKFESREEARTSATSPTGMVHGAGCRPGCRHDREELIRVLKASIREDLVGQVSSDGARTRHDFGEVDAHPTAEGEGLIKAFGRERLTRTSPLGHVGHASNVRETLGYYRCRALTLLGIGGIVASNDSEVVSFGSYGRELGTRSGRTFPALWRGRGVRFGLTMILAALVLAPDVGRMASSVTLER